MFIISLSTLYIIYFLEPQSKAGNVESCIDHPDKNTSVHSKIILIPDDSQNNHPEHSNTPFNSELSNNPDTIGKEIYTYIIQHCLKLFEFLDFKYKNLILNLYDTDIQFRCLN